MTAKDMSAEVRNTQVQIYLSHVVLGLRMAEIAKTYGVDRTIVGRACALIEDLRDDPSFDAKLSALELQWQKQSAKAEAIAAERSKPYYTPGLAEAHPPLYRAPGSRVNLILQFLLPRKTYERIFAQIVADMREEYFQALNENDAPLAKWRLCQIYITVVVTLFTWFATSVWKRAVDLYKMGVG